MNFSSHAAAWALRTTLTKLPFYWGQKQKSTLINKMTKNIQRITTSTYQLKEYLTSQGLIFKSHKAFDCARQSYQQTVPELSRENKGLTNEGSSNPYLHFRVFSLIFLLMSTVSCWRILTSSQSSSSLAIDGISHVTTLKIFSILIKTARKSQKTLRWRIGIHSILYYIMDWHHNSIQWFNSFVGELFIIRVVLPSTSSLGISLVNYRFSFYT